MHSTLKNKKIILMCLGDYAQLNDGALDATGLSQKTGLNSEEINEAVKQLESEGLVSLISWERTSPYIFNRIKITYKGRYEAHTNITSAGRVGNVEIPDPRYSGTIVVTGSTTTAFSLIKNAQGMLASAASSYKDGLPFIDPIIALLVQAADLTKAKEAEFLTKQQVTLPEYQRKLTEYGGLLNRKAEEKDFQTFFEVNPIFLSPNVVKFLPKKSFGGELIPDLILLLNSDMYLIVELEKPGVPLYNKKGDPTKELTHAEEQVRGYIRWALENAEFLKNRGLENISAHNTTGLVVIGSELTEAERKKLSTLNNSVRSMYIVKTFSDILEENKAILKTLTAQIIG